MKKICLFPCCSSILQHVVVVALLFLFFSLEPVTVLCSESTVLGDGGGESCVNSERLALLDFKSGLVDEYDRLSTWSSEGNNTNCCQWSGVRCSNKTGHVTELHLQFVLGSVSGKIGPSLLQLRHLKYLDLSWNDFRSAPLPNFIGSFSELEYLDLSWSNFGGNIPSQLGNLSHLKLLDLSDTNIGGTIPSQLGNLSHLEHLDLSYTNIGGTIPSQLGNLSHLEHLDLSHTNIGGNIPSQLGNLSHLKLLGLSYTNIDGTIPSQLGNLSHLKHLDLSVTNIGGTIPSQLGNLFNLKYLDFYRSNVGGTIPSQLGNLSQLEYLDIHQSKIGGNIPSQLGNLIHLNHLDLSGCNLGGTIPSQLGNLTSLSFLDVSYNRFDLKAENLEWLSPLSLLEDLVMDAIDLSKVTRWEGILMNLPSLHSMSLHNSKLASSLFPYHHSSSISINSSIYTINLSNNYITPSIYHWLFNLSTTLAGLYLSNNQLTGPIPEGFGNLTSLEYLDLSLNQLTSIFPKSLPTKLLSLNISSNHIQGTLPDLSTQIVVVDLSCNHFEGPIKLLPSDLQMIKLQQNNFSGDLSFLCHFSKGSHLTILDLSRNLLTGELPDCISNFQRLVVMSLLHNKLHGKIPTSIGSLNKLEVLYLYNNSFDGQLPLQLSDCTSLSYLNVGANKLSGNIPAQIGGKLTLLRILNLRSNNFSGTIPLELCHLSDLRILDLSMNRLAGTIPSCFNNFTSMVQKGHDLDEGIIHPFYVDFHGSGDRYVDYATLEWQGSEKEFNTILRFLTIIDLSSNNLTGVIPDEVALLHELVALNLSRNQLHGVIPQKIGELKLLLALDLSRNHLSGGIPASVSGMSLLNWLDLSYNNLSGRIPTSTQLQSFNPSQFIGNAGLCGPPLPRSCSSHDKPPLSSNVEDTDEFWRWFYIGGLTGFAIGFWTIVGVLLLNTRARQCFFVLIGNMSDHVCFTIELFIAKSLKLRR